MNLDHESNNPKKFWERIHLLLPKKNLSNHISLIDKETNEPIPDHETADYINNYFATIGSKLAEKFDTHWSFDGDNTEVMMDTLITNDIEILNIVKDIDVKKASSIENLSTRVLKDAFFVGGFLLLCFCVCVRFHAHYVSIKGDRTDSY